MRKLYRLVPYGANDGEWVKTTVATVMSDMCSGNILLDKGAQPVPCSY